MHLRYIISLYTSFGLHLSEEEYTQVSRNTCCYSSSIHHFFCVNSSRASTELRQRCITLISASQSEQRKQFLSKGSSAAGRSLLLGIPGCGEAAMLLTGMLWYPAGLAASPGSWSITNLSAFILPLAQHCYKKDHKPCSKSTSTLNENTPINRIVQGKK